MEAKCCENAMAAATERLAAKYIAVLKILLPALSPDQRKVFVKAFCATDAAFAELVDLL